MREVKPVCVRHTGLQKEGVHEGHMMCATPGLDVTRRSLTKGVQRRAQRSGASQLQRRVRRQKGPEA